ncbi:NAD(P)-dependent dehydrogenase (short-subunit alcohol dehydrogenase family) [Actinoplanes lutulentus]|uniref:NAD(P)-dependent dehydrogenase (Short-subunit alcohol dehydrogenase family) n=1 Tax=Actinoplanes lutulentus TaxID=1287878 RepID=A0A327Z1K4_9ACTN|nr:SDR family oxidoreductase [Actinoplanes lutulentus]MBB2943364.1 NAD(P)-dependent dehydrogenase (short-subunit alcohol dehydrogenase family) [Actinoplanes lutulentus]RAK28422.1 NAD(P)-dependent dehydrogenase (short-subunit alcohol dehydrogenase family) [Actinoplanes lutulentus]
MSPTTGRLAGKKAIVTGGSSGIGRAIALRYAEEGANVAILSRSPLPREGGTPTHELITAAGGVATHIPVDVADATALESAVEAATEQLGGLDIIATSAGTSGPLGDSREVSAEEVLQSLQVNMLGTFVAVRTALRTFAAQKSGRAVLVSSNFDRVGVNGFAAYCMAKAGITNLAKALAVEYGAYGVTVNVLSPGSTNTDMSSAVRANPGLQAAFRAATPLVFPDDETRIQAEPVDIAHAAVFLASDEARFMTGADIVIDGGWTAI